MASEKISLPASDLFENRILYNVVVRQKRLAATFCFLKYLCVVLKEDL